MKECKRYDNEHYGVGVERRWAAAFNAYRARSQ